MKELEAKTRAGAGLAEANPAGEIKTAMAGFLSDFNTFQSDIKSRLKEQEQRLTMLDRKSVADARPQLSRAADGATPHQKAFAAYLRRGDDDGLRGLQVEEKALSSAVNADGGYLVVKQVADRITGVLRGAGSVRAIANVVSVESNGYDVLVDTTDIGAGWASETAAQTETGTPVIERITIALHELSALPKASQRLLDDAAFDIEEWLAARIADKFSRAEGLAFVSGDGVDKPKGFLTSTKVANGSWAWGNLGYVATGSAADFNAAQPADAIVDLVYALGARYRANGTFVMNSKTAGAVRKMKDADGRFLWSDGLAAGEPARLLG